MLEPDRHAFKARRHAVFGRRLAGAKCGDNRERRREASPIQVPQFKIRCHHVDVLARRRRAINFLPNIYVVRAALAKHPRPRDNNSLSAR
jgi:hypothetical protein